MNTLRSGYLLDPNFYPNLPLPVYFGVISILFDSIQGSSYVKKASEVLLLAVS
jgi:hypothetical protein